MKDVLSGPLPPSLAGIRVPASLRTELLRLARAAAPDECCGLLGGRLTGEHAVVERLHPSANLAALPQREFEIDPALMFRIGRQARAEGYLVLGHYHSHPAGSAAPSSADRARAWAAGHVWLVVAPGRQPELTANLAASKGTAIVLKPLTIVP